MFSIQIVVYSPSECRILEENRRRSALFAGDKVKKNPHTFSALPATHGRAAGKCVCLLLPAVFQAGPFDSIKDKVINFG